VRNAHTQLYTRVDAANGMSLSHRGLTLMQIEYQARYEAIAAAVIAAESAPRRRTARVFSAPQPNAPDFLDQLQLGDLILWGDLGQMPYECQLVGHRHRTAVLTVNNRRAILIDLTITDRFTDALAHYADIHAQYDSLTRGIGRPRLLVRVSPTDAGLRREFQPHYAAEWTLVEQWTSIVVTRCDDRWWIYDVEFGHRPDRFLFESPWGRVQCGLPPLFDSVEPVARERIGARTRDLARLVDCYRLTLRTTTSAFLFATLVSPRVFGAELCTLLRAWSWTCTWLDDVELARSRRLDDYMFILLGPYGALDCAALATAAAALAGQQGGEPRITLVARDGVIETAGPPRVVPEYAALLDQFVLNQPPTLHRSVRTPFAWPHYQWRAVHALVLDLCLALAPARLPPYVLLEIFQRLPRMRFHIHIDVIRHIERIANSIKRLRKNAD
jgi:hypothetical protein